MSADRNPKDSMKSTWRGDRTQWGIHHWLLHLLNIHPTDTNRDIPVFQKDEKMPYISVMDAHKWVGVHAVWPLIIHQLYFWSTGSNLTPLTCAIFYTAVFKLNAIHEIGLMRHLGHRVGFLDGDKHERDQIPDHSVAKVLQSLLSTSTLRPFMTVYLTYTTAQIPSDISWWLPVEIGFYGLILDFYYYWYHRALHEVEWLWRFHRTHHLTKHPNPLLTLYADGVQELFDIALVPLATWATLRFLLGLPMGFYEWWVCHEYVVFIELWGHSGLRVFVTPPTTVTPLLRWLDAELRTEDHDLHHRQGWKKSGNYGKQTLLWDKVFGTAKPRIETLPGNIDWEKRVVLPIFYEWGF